MLELGPKFGGRWTCPMNTRPSGIPLRPDPTALRAVALAAVTRTATSSARDALVRAGLVTRATVAPTALANYGANKTIVADFIAALAPLSAGSQVLQMGLQLSFDGAAAISLPAFVVDASKVSFVAEGEPIPVRQLAASTPAQLV